ncbi:actin-depolymerizing factor 7 [Biomphalaria pfeifferi]|uniref:Actin-depolymerizing factor 7 n=1 Tax=Biomphalaria pfeifferi TaxID=112525 RepID=A0AAD8B055_BIOPF|nr:actin-depolymerizing factor 7 [Biomphalaria pfeifferi]
MASGIKISDEVKELYSKICMTSSKQTKQKYGIFKFSPDNKMLIVEKVGSYGDPDSDYDSVISSLPPNDVRYLAFDFDFVNKDGTKKSEMLLISWHPDNAPIRQKMVCASTFNALKAALSVSKNILEGDSYGEVDSKAALEKVGGKSLC